MTKLNRRSVAAALLAAAVVPLQAAKPRAAADPAHALDGMIAMLEGQKTISFNSKIDLGATAGKDHLQSLGSSVHVVSERGERLLAKYGADGDTCLLIKFGEATIFRPSKGLKTVLKPVRGSSPFAVPGLFLPYLGLLDADPRTSLFGTVQSVTALAEGLPAQPEPTDLVAVMASLFTGEIWIGKNSVTPARVIGTFFDGNGGKAASAGLTFSDWSAAPVTDEAFDLPGLAKAREVHLHKLGL